MSQAAVERTLGRLLTDEAFRTRFFRNPVTASFGAGLDLSPAEVEALSCLPVQAIARFSARLDARICRLPLIEDRERVGETQPAGMDADTAGGGARVRGRTPGGQQA